MSVVSKIKELNTMKKKDLLQLQGLSEGKLMDLDTRIGELMTEMESKRNEIVESVENEDQDTEKINRIKLEMIEKTYKDNVDERKNCEETLKAIAQIFEIREKRKTSARSRFYGLCGVFVCIAGIGLSYGTDMWGTMVNKNTAQAAKAAFMRFIPKL